MSLTRKMLKAMGIEDEKIDQIIEAHTETVDTLKNERDTYKADAEKLPAVNKQLDEANKALSAVDKDAYKVKYEAIKNDFEEYKAGITEKETTEKKTDAYKALLASAGVSEKRIASVLKVSDLSTVELDDEGKIKNADELTESIKTDWSDFIVATDKKGAKTSNPPATTSAKSYTAADIKGMTAEEINANWDSVKASLKSN